MPYIQSYWTKHANMFYAKLQTPCLSLSIVSENWYISGQPKSFHLQKNTRKTTCSSWWCQLWVWPPPSNCVKSRFIGIPYTENEMILVVTTGRRPHRSFNSSENICQIGSSLAGEKMLKINNVWECLRPPRGVSSHLSRCLVGLSGTSTRFEAVVLKAAWITILHQDGISDHVDNRVYLGKTKSFSEWKFATPPKKTDHSNASNFQFYINFQVAPY